MTVKNSKSENLNIEVKILKKRGRKPKNKDLNVILEPTQPKKRGRKPKIKTEEPPKIPKKRGRKPNSLINTDNKIIQENKSLKDNVLHLKINSEELNSNCITDIYNYNPEINNPKPYEPNDQIFKSLSLNLNHIEHKKPTEEIYENKSLINNIKMNDIDNIDKEIINNKYKKVNLKKIKLSL